jgi:di/tricarboxylate transporter
MYVFVSIFSIFQVNTKPLFGVVSASAISKAYINDTMFLLLGFVYFIVFLLLRIRSFFFSAAIEKWELHTRLAYRFLMLIGPRPKLLFLGIWSPFFISLRVIVFISNTIRLYDYLRILIVVDIEYCYDSNDGNTITGNIIGIDNFS